MMLRRVPLCTCLFLIATGSVAQDEATSLKEALAKGTPLVDFRYRYEEVDDDAFDSKGRASTLRTALGYRTKPYKGFSLYLEAENVTDIGFEDEHNNAGRDGLGNGITDRPVIADPALTEVNQAYLRFEGGKSKLTAGRQEINLGDQRFVGAVGWRQNHQSFDSFSFSNSSLDRVTFFYGFVGNANRIFGDNQHMASHLFNAGVETGIGTFTFQTYLLDYDAPSVRLSTATFGLELAGQRPVGEAKILYELELADQSDYADNPASISAGYAHAMIGGAFSGITVKGGFELLEGSPADGSFQTPLATLHKFNGWADKFLVTPANGLEDLYLSVGGAPGSFSWLAVYHDFSADTGGARYGSEIDLQATYRTPWEQLFGLKAAFYDADTFSLDTDKIWFWTAYRF